ncbi:MAG: glycoside hydrolase 15-related [Gammaproteobacteria bacterium]|nr:glycoside hydrolase 15-related [Gammaproteobacteria bacterium]
MTRKNTVARTGHFPDTPSAPRSAADLRGRTRAPVSEPAYPPIADYALIGDCHTAALVSRCGSIDWCCLPRFDSDSCFGRLLDWNKGGYFAVTPVGRYRVRREYLPDSLILVTTFTSSAGEVRLIDFFSMRAGGRRHPRREIVRVLHGVRGRMSFDVAIVPRLDFGEVKPWIYASGTCAHFAVGSNTGLRIFSDVPLQLAGDHDLRAQVEVRRGRKYHLGLQFFRPDETKILRSGGRDTAALRAHFGETRQWWSDWTAKIRYRQGNGVSIMRSAIVLKALSYAPTGAIVAAVTTSLPERVGGERNWDYRYCWVRDSIFTVRALGNLGLESEADGVRRFIQRSAAGNADELQVLYGVDGKRRLTEITLDTLDGWRSSRPVRIGNAADRQFQLDMYGLIVELSWRWSERGVSPDKDYWDFLVAIVEAAIEKYRLPDRGIWEIRSTPRHFVHSKVMCWAAVDGGIALAEKYSLTAPLDRWCAQRDEIRHEIETHGVDHRRGIFIESYGSDQVDAALLLLPGVDFVAFDDERMLRTTDVIRNELTCDGLILRYKSEDGLEGREGVFLACTFWLAECLARQGRRKAALRAFKRASAAANDVGLFAEQYAPAAKAMLGNFPQGLTHLAHIAAALALNPKRS